jgi:hypothetical protein
MSTNHLVISLLSAIFHSRSEAFPDPLDIYNLIENYTKRFSRTVLGYIQTFSLQEPSVCLNVRNYIRSVDIFSSDRWFDRPVSQLLISNVWCYTPVLPETWAHPICSSDGKVSLQPCIGDSKLNVGRWHFACLRQRPCRPSAVSLRRQLRRALFTDPKA